MTSSKIVDEPLREFVWKIIQKRPVGAATNFAKIIRVGDSTKGNRLTEIK